MALKAYCNDTILLITNPFTLQGIWTGMICGTAVQTLILAYSTYRCDWDLEVKSNDMGS